MVFTFAGKPGYQQFDFYRFNVAVVPQHVFKNYIEHRHRDRATSVTRSKLVGTGPYLYQSGVGAASHDGRLEEAGRLVGDEGARPEASAPTYVVDIKNGTNAAALVEPARREHRPLQQLRAEVGDQGEVQDVLHEGTPYHLGANTTWLFPNTTKKPLNDPAVPPRARLLDQHEPDPRQGVPGPRRPRRARPACCRSGTSGSTRPPSASTASRTTSRRRRRSSPPPATRTRTATGTSRTRTARRSTSSIVCPNGWSDWMTAIQVISDSAKAVGIKITPAFPEYGDDGRRPGARRTTTCCSATTGSTATRRGRTTSTSTSCRSRATRRRSTTSGTRTRPPGTSRRRWTRRRRRTPRPTRP